MASLTDIRSGIKTTISNNIAGMTCYDTVPDAANLPATIVLPDVANFIQAMGRGMDTYEFDLLVLVSANDMKVRQNELDTYVTGAGSKSIRQVIFNNKTLGLTSVDAHITGMTAYNEKYELSSVQHIGATLHLIVHTIGTA